jgi:hypothetical protein
MFIAFNHVKHCIILLRVVNESEKVCDGQASEKVLSPVMLMSSLTSMILLQNLTFSAMQASPGAYNPSFINAFII